MCKFDILLGAPPQKSSEIFWNNYFDAFQRKIKECSYSGGLVLIGRMTAFGCGGGLGELGLTHVSLTKGQWRLFDTPAAPLIL